MHRLLLCLVVLLYGTVSQALAVDYVCEDTVTATKFRRYVPSVDPTSLVLGTNELCTVVSEADTPDQRTINLGVPGVSPPTVPVKYRKVVNHLVVEMDSTEKGQVDAVESVIETQNQAYAQERADQQMCGEKQLEQLTTKLNNRKITKSDQLTSAHTAIDGVINAMTSLTLPEAKTILTQLTADYYARLDADLTDEYILFEKVARCLRAHVGLRQ
jgi:hypothetical protein